MEKIKRIILIPFFEAFLPPKHILNTINFPSGFAVMARLRCWSWSAGSHLCICRVEVYFWTSTITFSGLRVSLRPALLSRKGHFLSAYPVKSAWRVSFGVQFLLLKFLLHHSPESHKRLFRLLLSCLPYWCGRDRRNHTPVLSRLYIEFWISRMMRVFLPASSPGGRPNKDHPFFLWNASGRFIVQRSPETRASRSGRKPQPGYCLPCPQGGSVSLPRRRWSSPWAWWPLFHSSGKPSEPLRWMPETRTPCRR